MLEEDWTQTGILFPERFYRSPNIRPNGLSQEVSLLVIHCFGLPGCYYIPAEVPWEEGEVHQIFMASDKVSAHFVIRRSGECMQYVSTHDIAFHAGVSEFEGREKCNDYSLGIELEGHWEDPSGYTDAQYQALIQLTRTLQKAYPLITQNRIVSHQFIARWPKGQERPEPRKLDPGPYFNWIRYKNVLHEGMVVGHSSS